MGSDPAPGDDGSALNALSAFVEPLVEASAAVEAADLPSRRPPKRAPCTFADALSQVSAREEAKKRALAAKKDAKKGTKQRVGAVSASESFRGAMQGADLEPSAFWMVMEVRPPQAARLIQHALSLPRPCMISTNRKTCGAWIRAHLGSHVAHIAAPHLKWDFMLSGPVTDLNRVETISATDQKHQDL